MVYQLALQVIDSLENDSTTTDVIRYSEIMSQVREHTTHTNLVEEVKHFVDSNHISEPTFTTTTTGRQHKTINRTI